MKPLSRRTFLVGIPTATVALTVFQGCKENKPVSCNAAEALSPLSEAERTARTSSQYVDSSKLATKNCENCTHYEAAPGPGQCGGCKVVKGPIHPAGYCNLWVEKTG